ncbi:hypothetical protein L6164_037669 [Bauhinia variegata]|uniref:Uncharacterized protein n=1 Tax=Bauhinia variegata TaxID=167791 RepID=A0ACB9KKS3_BAUVA|nr:hypothetical protein L6164_037669 [Bauhinia variegata]
MPIIKVSNHEIPPNSHSPSFLSTAPQLEIADIEMITIPAVRYTSLRDIMPDPPPHAMIVSPANNSSWYEIPIKNPLVKQAALAYLQPMLTPPEVGNKGLFGKLKEKCLCGREELGCLCWLSDVVLKTMNGFFRRCCGGRCIEQEEEQYHKVD